MLSVLNLSKSYGLNTVLKKITFSINRGEKAALVGPNGCGKSTLFNIIAGEETADSGQVSFTPADLRIGYLHQGIIFDPAETVGDYLNRFASNLEETQKTLEAASKALAEAPGDPLKISDYERCLSGLIHAQEIEGARKEILTGFDLLDYPQKTPIATLSGGQKVRLALAGVLLEAPHFLILDEPTNHLDLEMRVWLQDWVLAYPGSILLVSHDRAFLDTVIDKIIAFPPSGEGVKEYPGNYTLYLERRQAEYQAAMDAYTDQKGEIKNLKKAARSVRDLAKPHKGGKADPEHTDGFSAGYIADRSQGTFRRAKQLEKRIEYLEGQGALEKPSQAWDLRMNFQDVSVSGRIVLQLEGLRLGYDESLLMAPISQTVTLGQRIALVGPNGIGKTTLFKTILGEIPPVSGNLRLGAGVRPGYLSQEQEVLNPACSVIDTLQHNTKFSNHTEARTFLHRFLFSGDDVFQLVETLSYGQRSRLMLALLVANQCNLLLLDEPLNHLDLSSQEAFEHALAGFSGTILASGHDRYFIERFAQVIWHFSKKGIVAEIITIKPD